MTMMEKPLPVPTPTSRPFWEGLRQRKVLLQRCLDCEVYVHYPRSNCPNCLGANLEWREVSGLGTLYTYTIARRPTAPQFQDETPQKIAVVELDEGPRLTTTLVNVDEAAIKVGMRVRPVFEDVQGTEVTLLRYEPA
ncbi:MAG TPA: Zn-ribbon domain-containing OB-fold protein [Dehalococcoidia bacterium]|nr:Zn-ribbon domain-containing OB-fold protein [Dehalococcoidia bacterium]